MREKLFLKSTSNPSSRSWETESRLKCKESTKATSFNTNPSFTLMDPTDLTLPRPLSPKVMYSLCITGVRLENHCELPVMCLEHPESTSQTSSRPPSCTSTTKRAVSKCLDTGVRKVSRKPVPSHLFNSGVRSIHNTPNTLSPGRTTITTVTKAWCASPLRLKATPVLSRVVPLTTRSTSGKLTHATRLSRLPHTPPGRRLMYPLVRMVCVLVPLLTLTPLIPLPPKAKLLKVALLVTVVTPKHNSLGLRRLFRW